MARVFYVVTNLNIAKQKIYKEYYVWKRLQQQFGIDFTNGSLFMIVSKDEVLLVQFICKCFRINLKKNKNKAGPLM